MITAVDTSVLLDVFAADPTYVQGAQWALRKAMKEGALIACEVVWAELRPFFEKRSALTAAMGTLGIDFVPIDREGAMLAGEVWKVYRRAGGPRMQLIPDFIIAAHAQQSADRLLTRDRGFYRKWFAGLKVLEP